MQKPRSLKLSPTASIFDLALADPASPPLHFFRVGGFDEQRTRPESLPGGWYKSSFFGKIYI
jgi:hypothetical protein